MSPRILDRPHDRRGLIATMGSLAAGAALMLVAGAVIAYAREFLAGRDEFTVNVAILTNGAPVAGIIAVPAGIILHHNVLPAMAHAANSGLPASVISVFSLPEMIGLALAGLVIAVAGALAPASWAARSRTAAALRTE